MARTPYMLEITDSNGTPVPIPLVYDMAALDWFEAKSGHSLLPAIGQHMGSQTLTWLVLAGARYNRPDMTYEVTQALIDAYFQSGKGSFATIMRSLMEALRYYGVIPRKEYDESDDRRRPLAVAGGSPSVRD